MNGAGSLRAAVAAGLVAVLAGCGATAGDGAPVPTSSTGTTMTPPVPDTPPRVERPKNLAGVRLCALLTDAQRGKFGFPEQGVELRPETSTAGGCKWETLGASGTFVGFSVKSRLPGSGLDQLYKDRYGYSSFVPVTVDGYPGVRLDTAPGSCALRVGVSEDQSLEVDFAARLHDKPLYQDGCARAEEMVKAVLGNIPG